jgi:hypothetical protein
MKHRSIKMTNYLTVVNPELDRFVRNTPAGMAHWSGTGPDGTTCNDCRHFGFREVKRDKQGNVLSTTRRDERCGRFYDLMNRCGDKIRPATPSCRHFEPKRK